MTESTPHLRAPAHAETLNAGPRRPNLRSRLALPVVLAAIALLLALPFRSISLDDFDSYSFALALDTYDLRLQQPQPPGFPVYIALARGLYRVRPDPVFALTMLSAIAGAASVWLVYQVGRCIDPRRNFTAVAAALIFSVVPVSWLTAGKALSDMPGLAGTLLSLWLWLRWRSTSSAQPPYLAALVTGISLGVRPQNALPVVLLAGSYLMHDVGRPERRRRLLAIWLPSAATGVAGILLWLIPTAAASRGLRSYLSLVQAHAGHVGQADALLGMDEPLARALRIRLIAFADTGLTALTGTGLYPQNVNAVRPIGTLLPLVAWGIGILAGLLAAGQQRRQGRQVAIWWMATAVQVLIFETLDRPRLLLPLLPPLCLLAAAGWARIFYRVTTGARLLRAVLFGAAFLAVALQTLPWVTTLSQVPAPPAQATHYLAETYVPTRTLVAAAGSFRAAQLELPGYPLSYLYTFDPQAVADRLASGIDYVAILDRDQFTAEAIATLSQEGALVTVEDRLFSRDRRVHTQHDQVRLQVLAPPELVPAAALALPDDGCLDLGTEIDGRYLGPGWYRPESIAGTTARWAGGDLTATLRVALPAAINQALYFRALSYPPDQTVTVSVGDQVLGTVHLTDTWSEAHLALPHGRFAQEGVLVVELAHTAILSPFEAGGGASSDRRELTAAYDWICVRPSPDAAGED